MTAQQVKQALELALSLVENMGTITEKDSKELSGLLEKIKVSFQEEPTVKKTLKHPIDTLLKKGKVKLSEKRYEQLCQIVDEVKVMGVKILSAKQNDHVTWFPLEMNEDKTAALYLTGGGWAVEPLSVKANGELSGEWEGFDLIEFMAMNCPEFDQDDY